MAIVQLSPGPLEGRLRIYSLGAYRISVLNTSQTLFLTGTRRPKPCTISIPLRDPQVDNPIRAQGYTMPWPGVMGYNHGLRDFDLRLPANTALATLIINKEHLLERHCQHRRSNLIVQRWEHTNQLQLRATTITELRKQLLSLIDQDGPVREPITPDKILSTMMEAFADNQAETLGVAKRETRHEAAIELLHWFTRHPGETSTTEELSRELFQSRTSLFKGCQEHFGRSPQELQRLIRLDLVRQLLLDPQRCNELGLKGVGAIAAHLGFGSRSHFARRYSDQYLELPQQTLSRVVPNRS